MKNFDEKIRDKLYDAEMPVSDNVWDFIDSQISTKKERPKYWIFFVVSLIGLPSLFLTYKYLSIKEIPTEVNNTFVQIDSKAITLEEDSDALINHTSIYQSESGQHIDSPNFDNPQKLITKTRTNSSTPIGNILLANKSKKRKNIFSSVKSKSTAANFEVKVFDQSKLLNQPITLENRLHQNVVQLNKTRKIILNKSFVRTPQCPSFNGKISSFYLYSNSTLDYPFQSLNSSEPEDYDYINSRNSTESSFVSFSFDAGLGFELNDRFFIQAGLMYNQINTKFYYKEVGSVRNRTITTIDTTFDSSGGIIDTETHTFVVQEQGTKETSSLNKFKQIDVPLSLGYRLPIGNRFNLMMSSGVILNLKTTNSGKFLDRKEMPISFADGISDGSLFSTKVGLSYTGAVKLETEVYPDLFVNAGLNFRYYDGQFNSSLNTISQRYTSIGLGLGIRYKL